MRLAVIADIHGNCLSLDTVLADLESQPVDGLVCLGDAVQGGPQPAQVVARLRQLACPVVMGNADAWLLSGVETGREVIGPERLRKMQAVREWSLAQLSPGDMDFIRAFTPTVTLPIGSGRSLLGFHGSPASFDDILLPDTPEADFRRLLSPFAGSILAGGHTHLQQIRRIGDYFFFNPGSVGLAYRHQQPAGRAQLDPWAEYAILDATDAGTRLEFRTVPIDLDALLEVYRASGRPFSEDAAEQFRPGRPPA